MFHVPGFIDGRSLFLCYRISVLLFIGSYFPDLLCVKHLIGILILVYSFQICVYYFVSSLIKVLIKKCVRKHSLVAC